MGIYERYRAWCLAEEYERSANRHFMFASLSVVVMGICLLVGCLISTMQIITICSVVGSFALFFCIWHWIEGECDKDMARDFRTFA